MLEDEDCGFVKIENAVQFESILTRELRFSDVEDVRSPFKYEDVVIRPSDAIKLWELLNYHHKMVNVYQSLKPTGLMNGKTYLIESKAFPDFDSLYQEIDNVISQGATLILYNISKVRCVSAETFEPRLAFKLRYAVVI
ncbi:hypothetical protein phiOC_p265 [Ochrobactrum phage vB_OspM_OC]|nr:hypothetical protein phiOC_p265 [Ochrobactrum phage vB_OspM_OC]